MKKHVFKNSTYILVVPEEKSVSDIRESLAKNLVDEIKASHPRLTFQEVTYRWENPQTKDETDLVIELLQGKNNVRLTTLEFGIRGDNKTLYVRDSSRHALARWIIYDILEKYPELVIREYE